MPKYLTFIGNQSTLEWFVLLRSRSKSSRRWCEHDGISAKTIELSSKGKAIVFNRRIKWLITVNVLEGERETAMNWDNQAITARLHLIGGEVIDQTEKFSDLIVDMDTNHCSVFPIKPPRKISSKEHPRDLSDASPTSNASLLMCSICVITE